ncbi:Uncharacterised protein [Mycobacteroides abscessus subsp. abscessus]|nr:Uncharacterised protein [Mycobacteroides abscessus subsp. abscessus]
MQLAIGVEVDRLTRQVPVLGGIKSPVRVVLDHLRVGESASTAQ